MTTTETAADLGSATLFQGPGRYVPSSPWGPIAALVVTVVACVASFGVFTAALLIALARGGDESQLAGLSAELASLANPSGVLLVVLSQCVSLAVIWLAAGRKGKRSEVLRLSDQPGGWGIALRGGVFVVAVTGFAEALMYLTVGFDPFADSKWLAEGLRSNLWWATVIIALVLAPLWEELTFRGFLLSALAQTRLGFWPAAVVSSGLWTFLHWGYSYPGLASVFIAGLLLSWLMQRTGLMRTVVVAHAMANLAALAFTYAYAPGLQPA